jgi:hypothetical protein
VIVLVAPAWVATLLLAASPAPSPRVFTEEDLVRTRGVTESPSPRPSGKPGTRPAPARPSPSPTPIWPSAAPDTSPADQQRWRGRARQARERIAAAEARVAEVEGRIVELREDRGQANLMDPNREQTRLAQITAAEKELEAARAAVQAARQAQLDLEDEARRKNVPPGWLRE